MSYVLYIVVSYKLHYVIFVQNTPLFNFKELAFGSPFDAVPTPKQSSLSKKKKKIQILQYTSGVNRGLLYTFI